MKKGRKQSNGRHGKRFAHILTREFLIEEYTKKEHTPYEIAKMVGCNHHTVYSYIDYYQIERIDFRVRKQLKPNQQFYWLTTIKESGKTNRYGMFWKCKCKCGKITEVKTADLKFGKVKSCGCRTKRTGDDHHLWKGYCDVSGKLLSEIRLRARKKNFDFDIDAKFLWELFKKQNSQCALTGLKIEQKNNASLDRIDNNKGYIKDNVWWVHKDINKMKMDLALNHFIDMCNKVTQYNKETK